MQPTKSDFGAASREVNDGTVHEDLLAMATSEALGDAVKTRAIYIRMRADEIAHARRLALAGKLVAGSSRKLSKSIDYLEYLAAYVAVGGVAIWIVLAGAMSIFESGTVDSAVFGVLWIPAMALSTIIGVSRLEAVPVAERERRAHDPKICRRRYRVRIVVLGVVLVLLCALLVIVFVSGGFDA